ncbi:MAG TPA: nuclear transport factor 2 family protein [Baekduia sp.]|nr:nuclear transport factor 2 family protein [Baekduia sp.]
MGDDLACVRALYPALAAGDRAALEALLAEDFTGEFAAGMPVGGGPAASRAEALEHWWAIGRAFAVRAEPEELLRCEGGRVVVRGAYRGRRRAGGGPVEAAFLHLWRLRDGRAAHLVQVTDTARWG